jgi:SAM-dependent methyltransferase
MLLAGRTDFRQVLDLPCGGGRVTRHLVKFFPDATIFVGDIDAKKQAFVVSQFGTRAHEAPHDFSSSSRERFDLIFVGSLVTHLPKRLYRAAVDYFLDALVPGGILILTTHGRTAATVACVTPSRLLRWRHICAVHGLLGLRGFAYVGSIRLRWRNGVRYGGSFNTPSWAVGLIERRADARLLGFKENAWGDVQDVLIAQKLPL